MSRGGRAALWSVSASLVVGLAGCSDSAVSPIGPDLAATRSSAAALAAIPGVPIYGIGRSQLPDGPRRCTTPRFQQFDFWRGFWSVSVGGAFAAVNPVTSRLDGCVLEEHWTPVGGLPGRSLSSYDELSQEWRQTWVTAGGRPFRLHGNLRPDGVMEMSSVRIHWYFGYHYIDTYTWTKVGANGLVQASKFDLPEIDLHLSGALDYTRKDQLPTVALGQGDRCKSGGDTEETRNLDFMVGNWSVEAGSGDARQVLGRSTIVVDHSLSDCLVEETFTGQDVYRGLGWSYFDPIVNHYYRTYVDSGGNRIELEGDVVDGKLVMTGLQPLPDGSAARVRVTWERLGAELLQTWERS
ncbi:MAG: hypothetical protein ABI647_24175, partial [Gemmatimonadota bacterium]